MITFLVVLILVLFVPCEVYKGIGNLIGFIFLGIVFVFGANNLFQIVSKVLTGISNKGLLTWYVDNFTANAYSTIMITIFIWLGWTGLSFFAWLVFQEWLHPDRPITRA